MFRLRTSAGRVPTLDKDGPHSGPYDRCSVGKERMPGTRRTGLLSASAIFLIAFGIGIAPRLIGERVDPHNKKYYWLTGKFVHDDKGEDTDVWALDHGYVSIVPVQFDFTAHHAIPFLNKFKFDAEKV